jgi:hypothetical protein
MTFVNHFSRLSSAERALRFTERSKKQSLRFVASNLKRSMRADVQRFASKAITAIDPSHQMTYCNVRSGEVREERRR